MIPVKGDASPPRSCDHGDFNETVTVLAELLAVNFAVLPDPMTWVSKGAAVAGFA